MTPIDTTMVPEQEPIQAGDTPAALNSEGQVPSGTLPNTAPKDAELQTLIQKVSQYEKDINNLKSFADKRVNEVRREAKEREEQIMGQLHEFRISQLPEEERAAYIEQLRDAEQEQLYERVQQADMLTEEYTESKKAIAYFLDQGVPLTDLVLDKGYEELYQSGFGYITKQYQTLRQKSAPTPPPPPNAPPVETGGGPTPNVKASWSDLEKKYGDREAVYRLVDSGRLPSSIIPLN
jgi:hypothetical protein